VGNRLATTVGLAVPVAGTQSRVVPNREESPVLRALVTGGFLIVAAIIVSISFLFGVDTTTGNLLINLGTEIIGIVLTVAIVEWFFERRRLQGRGRQLAWDSLHAVGHAVWVWQGGPREADTADVLGILDAVDDGDSLADFTEGLMLGLGTKSRRLLNDDQAPVIAMPGLMDALEHLSRLSSIRDSGESVSPRKVADILEEGTKALAQTVGRPAERHLVGLIRYRDPSIEEQERRHLGVNARLAAQQGPRSDFEE
jgi:hypothetical protein